MFEDEDLLGEPRPKLPSSPPKTWDDVVSPVARKAAGGDLAGHDAAVALDYYVRDYNSGYAAGKRGSGLNENTTAAWDDGCLDARAERPKWHLTYCPDHTCPEV